MPGDIHTSNILGTYCIFSCIESGGINKTTKWFTNVNLLSPYLLKRHLFIQIIPQTLFGAGRMLELWNKSRIGLGILQKNFQWRSGDTGTHGNYNGHLLSVLHGGME